MQPFDRQRNTAPNLLYYNGKRFNLQGDGSPMPYYSGSVKKEWSKPKLSLTLLAVNPFNEYTPALCMSVLTIFIRIAAIDIISLTKLTLNWEFGTTKLQPAAWAKDQQRRHTP